MNLSPKIIDPEEDPFLTWGKGIKLDSTAKFSEAAANFNTAALAFFKLASAKEELARAFYEYSTLMDAYERIESGREEISLNRFDEGLACFAKSSEILRSTIHFGYVAPYASACASAEVTDMLNRDDPDCLEGYRNSIALFEQSKIALGFQDEIHPTIAVIDKYIRYCISQSLQVESLELLKKPETIPLAIEKEKRARELREESGIFRKKGEAGRESFSYLPVRDYKRAREGSFIVSHPDASGLSLLNIGTNRALLHSAGNYSLGGKILEVGSSVKLDSRELGKGKIRVSYTDAVTRRKFEEGCLLVI